MSGSIVEHSIPLGIGARAIAKREGIEVRQGMNGFTEEVVALLTWRQLDHLRARMLNAR